MKSSSVKKKLIYLCACVFGLDWSANYLTGLCALGHLKTSSEALLTHQTTLLTSKTQIAWYHIYIRHLLVSGTVNDHSVLWNVQVALPFRQNCLLLHFLILFLSIAMARVVESEDHWNHQSKDDQRIPRKVWPRPRFKIHILKNEFIFFNFSLFSNYKMLGWFYFKGLMFRLGLKDELS